METECVADARELALHREVVKGAMTEILGLKEIDGRAVASIVDEFYDGMKASAAILVLHDDPLRLAYLLSGDQAESKMTVEEERLALSELWSAVESRLVKSDNGDVEAAEVTDEANAEKPRILKPDFKPRTSDPVEGDRSSVFKANR